MAGSVNKVILIGNLGKDPEIRRTQDGRPVANLRIATTESWRDKTTGERREKTEWHSVVIFSEGLCRVAEQYLKKGAKVYIEGAAADAQVAGPGRPGPLLHRSGAAGLQQRAHHARLARRGCGRRRRRRHARGRSGRLRRPGRTARSKRAAGAGGKGFDKQVDDEIPF